MNDELKYITRAVLDCGYLMSLGTVDEHGPWVSDVIYIHDDEFNMYWMSTTERRHSKAIDGGHNRVAAAIVIIQGPDQPDEGLQISGIAKRLEEPSSDLLNRWIKKKGKGYVPEMGVVMEGHTWYQLIPDRIELIYEEKFGYDRQKVL